MAKVWKVPSKVYNHLPMPTYQYRPQVFYSLCEKQNGRWIPISNVVYSNPAMAARVFAERLFRGNAKPREIRPVKIETTEAK